MSAGGGACVRAASGDATGGRAGGEAAGGAGGSSGVVTSAPASARSVIGSTSRGGGSGTTSAGISGAVRACARVHAAPPQPAAMTSTSVAPCLMQTWMSRIDKSKWNGACAEKRSVAAGLKVSEHQSTKLTALSCDSM